MPSGRWQRGSSSYGHHRHGNDWDVSPHNYEYLYSQMGVSNLHNCVVFAGHGQLPTHCCPIAGRFSGDRLVPLHMREAYS
jgi:hypothetical protein